MKADIASACAECDFLSVSLHKGTVHTPALVMPCEKQIARAAVDAGADRVVSHHAHIPRGIEIYQGKPIYHGLGSFVTLTHALSPQGVTDPNARAMPRLKLFGFVPDADTPGYPFHPESRNTLLPKCIIGANARCEAVVGYLQDITQGAGFTTRFCWDGDEVLVL